MAASSVMAISTGSSTPHWACLRFLPCGTAIISIDSHEILVEGIVELTSHTLEEPLVGDVIAIT